MAIVMIFVANKMLEVKNKLTKNVLGSYYSQMEEINKESGMKVYNLDKKKGPASEVYKFFKNLELRNQ